MALESTATLGVLDDDGMLTYSYKTRSYGKFNVYQTFQINSLLDLLRIAHALEITNLWLAPGSRLSHEAKDLMERRRGVNIYEKSTIAGDGTPLFLLIESTPDLKIAWPEWDSRWPWAKCSDASTLFNSLLYLQDVLEAEIAWGPGHVGQGIIKKLNIKHPTWLAPVELPAVMKDKKNYAVDMHWHRPLVDEEKQPGMWLHLFDGNSKYLAACTSVNIGEGEPIHITDGPYRFDPRMPGMWRIGYAWKWTPELEYDFAGLEQRPDIDEAYVWPRYHQALRSWGEYLWDGRQALKYSLGTLGTPEQEAACELALEALKEVYVQAHGWFPKQGRPDIWCMIVAAALRSTGFKRRQMAQPEHGLEACYWKADMLGFVSLGPDRECYRSMLNRAGLLGGYKHVVSGPLTPELAAAFDEDFGACDKALGQWREIYE